MKVSQFHAILRYGAILSVIGSVIALLAIVIGGRLNPLGLPLAVVTPLCGFFFIGGVLQLQNDPTHRVVGEELLRGIVWYGGSLLGWALITTSSSVLPATAFTVVGLPVLTALGLILVMVGTRLATGLELNIQTKSGQLLALITVSIVSGFLVLSFILAGGRSPSLGLVYGLGVVVGVLVWLHHWQHGHTASETG